LLLITCASASASSAGGNFRSHWGWMDAKAETGPRAVRSKA
jgi:hypothetical protein